MFPSWIRFLKRPPRAGGGKDPTMSQSTQSPGMAVPGAAQAAPASSPAPSPAPPGAAPAAPPDVSRQIADLTDAVNRLVQAQQAQTQRTPSPPGARDASADIGGDLPGGEPLVAAIDHAKLSPLQQITLGLRGVTPVGLTHPAVERSGAVPPRGGAEENAPAGAD